MEDLSDDCRTLKELLQVSIHVHPTSRTTWAYRVYVNLVGHGGQRVQILRHIKCRYL